MTSPKNSIFIFSVPAKALSFIGSAAIAAMLLHGVIEVFSRTALGHPLPGSLEIITFWYMPLIAFIGMYLAYKNNEHISVALLTSRLQPGTQWVIHIFVSLVTLVFLALVVWYSFEHALIAFERGEYTGINHVPVWPLRFVVPIALFAFGTALAAETIRLIKQGSLDQMEEIIEPQ